jgi:hypothetical protein
METKIVTDIEEVINYSLSYQAMNPHHQLQIEVINKEDNSEFLTFCHSIAEIEFVDELSGFQRKRSNTLKFEDVIGKAPTGIKCGMKVNHFPQYKIDNWEKWEDGYIQVYIRMDSNVKGNEWFIWQYIRMKHLPEILNQFQDKLEYFYIPLTTTGPSRV